VADGSWLDRLANRLSPHPEFALTRVSDPRAAREHLAAGFFDLLLVDWSLPGNAARDLIAAASDRTPVLALISPGDEAAGQAALEAGAVDYVLADDAALADITHAMARALTTHSLRQELARGCNRDITDRKHHEQELARLADQMRRLSLHLQSVREDERSHAARRIHDELGQVLTALRMDAVWLQRHLPSGTGDLAGKAATMADLAGDTIRTVQTLCAELRPRILDDLGIGPALEWQAGEVATRTGMACTVTIQPEDLVLDRERATAVFRIFQEAVANAARHAGARNVQASLVRDGGVVTLTVSDDGRGITPAQAANPSAFGLLQIRERVAAFGGSMQVEGTPKRGTRLIAVLPLGDER
jgi:two-component system sensor histidine kinase UhpB